MAFKELVIDRDEPLGNEQTGEIGRFYSGQLVDDTQADTKYFEYRIEGTEYAELPPSNGQGQRRAAMLAIIKREAAAAYEAWAATFVAPKPLPARTREQIAADYGEGGKVKDLRGAAPPRRPPQPQTNDAAPVGDISPSAPDTPAAPAGGNRPQTR